MSEFLVISPCYNEGKHIERFVKDVFRIVKKEDFLIVDDGSSDETPEILEKLEVNFIRKVHAGKGSAISEGIREAERRGKEFIVLLDSDLQHPPEYIPEFIDRLKAGSDIVIGSRWKELDKMPRDRYLSNRLTTFFVSVFLSRRLQDTQSGFRGYRLKLFEGLRLETTQYETETEILIKLLKGRKVKIDYVYIPVIYGKEHSKINRVKDTLRFLKMYFRLLWRAS